MVIKWTCDSCGDSFVGYKRPQPISCVRCPGKYWWGAPTPPPPEVSNEIQLVVAWLHSQGEHGLAAAIARGAYKEQRGPTDPDKGASD